MNMTNYATDAAPQQNFLDPVQAASKGSQELAAHLTALADRLVGMAPQAPQNAAAGKLSSVPVSVFDAVSNLGRQINGDINAAFDAVSRIERALP